jgi:fumarate hydratase class II
VIPVRFQDGPFDLDAEILRLVWLISFVTFASEIAREAVARGISLVDVIVERGLYSEDELSRLLDPGRMTGPEDCK